MAGEALDPMGYIREHPKVLIAAGVVFVGGFLYLRMHSSGSTGTSTPAEYLIPVSGTDTGGVSGGGTSGGGGGGTKGPTQTGNPPHHPVPPPKKPAKKPTKPPTRPPAKPAASYVTVTSDAHGTSSPFGTLSGIAGHEHTTVGALLKLNPQVHNPNLVYTGERIRVR